MADDKSINNIVQQALDRLHADKQQQSMQFVPTVTYPDAPTSEQVQQAVDRFDAERQGIPAAIAAPPEQLPVGIAAPSTLPVQPEPGNLNNLVPQIPGADGIKWQYNRMILPEQKSYETVQKELAAQQEQAARSQQLTQTGLPGLVSVGLNTVPNQAPPSLMAQKPGTLEQLVTPKPEEVENNTAAKLANQRQQNTELASANRLQEIEQQKEDRFKQLEQEAKNQIEALDNQTRTKSLGEIMSGGTFGQKLGAAVALGLGAVSQGLSGAKTNPVMDYLDKTAEQQAAKDKLTAEQKDSLRKNLYQQAHIELQKLEQDSTNQYRKQQLALERKKLEVEQNNMMQKLLMDAMNKQQNASKYSGLALTPQQEAALTNEDRRNMVTLPDGRRVLTQSYEDANKFKESSTAIANALSAIGELETLGKTGSSISLDDRARANAALTKVVGALRLPYTGPGVLTDSERAMLADTLGNPLSFWKTALGLRGVEMQKLQQVKKDLQANLINEARIRGIRESVVPEKYYNVNGKAIAESDLVNAYKQKYPGLSEEKIRLSILNKMPGL